MKIGFDAKRAFVNKSGLGNYSRDLIRALYNFYPNNEYLLFSPQSETVLLEPEYLKNTISPKTNCKIQQQIWRTYKITNEIKNHKLDIYHGLSNELPANIGKADTLKIVTIHDLIFLKLPYLYSFIDRKIYYKKFYNACKIADIIIATSNQTKTDIINFFGTDPQKIEVVYQSCNKIFEQKIDADKINSIKSKHCLPENYILSVGTIEERKNTLKILEAIHLQKIDTKLVLVGRKTKYYDKIKTYAEKYGLENKLLCLDQVATDELPAIYQAAKLFAYPSIYEGFGIPILEAFNSNIPVLTSNIGSTAEIAGDAAIKIDPLDTKKIGAEILSILQDKNYAMQLVKLGEERRTLFNNKTVCDNMAKIYNQL